LFFILAFFLIRLLDRGTPLSLTFSVPIAWTAVEFLRGNFLGGFPWYFLAHTQHDFTTLIQISDITGAYGVTFLVAAINGLIFEFLYRVMSRLRRTGPHATAGAQSWAGLLTQAACVAVLLACVVAYGLHRLAQASFTNGPRV